MKTAFAESFDSSRTAANGAAVLSLTLLAICGCQNMAVTKEDSSRNIAAETVSAPYTQAEAVSAVGGRYFPTDDGEEDMTYEVVVRNASGAPVEFAAPVLDGRELKTLAPAVASALKEFSFDFGGAAARRHVRNPSDPDVRWWQFYPSPSVPPGGYVSFTANFKGRAKPHSLELRTADGRTVRHAIPRHAPGRRTITYLGFSGDGGLALVRHSKGAAPCKVSVSGGTVANAKVLEPANAGLPGGVVVPLARPAHKGDSLFVELEFPGGGRAFAFARALPGVFTEAPFANRDDEPLPEAVRRRFGFDDELAVRRLPHDVACDDVRAKDHGASAAACLASRKAWHAAHPDGLCGVDFCTALYRGVWNVYAPMADAVFTKPYRLHWGATPARFMEEEDAMLAAVVRRTAPRPAIWVPERFRRTVELDGREFEQLAWCAVMRGVRVVRCHHWKNDALKPFDGNPGLEEALVRFNSRFRRVRPLLEKLIPADGWTDRAARAAVLEGWCADEGVLLLVRNLDYDNGIASRAVPRAHPFRSTCREDVTIRYAPPKWFEPGAAADALDGSPVAAEMAHGRLELRIPALEDFKLLWIPASCRAAEGASTSKTRKEHEK